MSQPYKNGATHTVEAGGKIVPGTDLLLDLQANQTDFQLSIGLGPCGCGCECSSCLCLSSEASARTYLDEANAAIRHAQANLACQSHPTAFKTRDRSDSINTEVSFAASSLNLPEDGIHHYSPPYCDSVCRCTEPDHCIWLYEMEENVRLHAEMEINSVSQPVALPNSSRQWDEPLERFEPGNMSDSMLVERDYNSVEQSKLSTELNASVFPARSSSTDLLRGAGDWFSST